MTKSIFYAILLIIKIKLFDFLSHNHNKKINKITKNT